MKANAHFFGFLLLLLSTSTIQAQTESIFQKNVVTDSAFNLGAVHDIYELIEAQFPGIFIERSGSDRNTDFMATVRGVGTMIGMQNPLIVVDGVINAPISAIDPNDVAQIELVRGAASARYGMQGASGVLEITTKQGSAGGPRVSFHSFAGIESKIYKQKVYEREGFLAAGGTDLGSDIDWIDHITQTGFNSANHISVSGQTSKLNYRFGANYRIWDGILRNTGFDRSNLSGSVNWQFTNRLQLQYSGNWTNEQADLGLPQAFQFAHNANPTMPIYFPNGTSLYQAIAFEYYNPEGFISRVSDQRERDVHLQTVGLNFQGDRLNAFVRGTFSSIQNLTIADFDDEFFYLTNSHFGSNARSNHEFYSGGIQFNEKQKGNWRYNISLAGDFQRIDREYFSMRYYQNLRYPQDVSRDSSFTGVQLWSVSANLIATWKDWVTFNLSDRFERSSALIGETKGHFFLFSTTFDIGYKFELPYNLQVRLAQGRAGLTPFNESLNREVGDPNFEPDRFNPLHQPDFTFESNINREFEVAVSPASGLWNLALTRYQRKSDNVLNMLMYGIGTPYTKNGTSINNSGWELRAGLTSFINDYTIKSEFMLTTLTTEFLEVPRAEGFEDYDYDFGPYTGCGCSGNRLFLLEEGQPYGAFFANRFSGQVEQNEMMLLDLNQDGHVDRYDRDVVGQLLPQYVMNWRNEVSFGSTKLVILIESSLGHYVLNKFRIDNSENFRYQPHENRIVNNQGIDAHWVRYSDVFVEDASYVRLRNLSISQDLKIANYPMTIYLAGNNLFTISGYSGNDPIYRLGSGHAGGSLGRQGNLEWLPVTTFTLGLNASF